MVQIENNIDFGIHSATFHNPDNGKPYEHGMFLILGNATGSSQTENIVLNGGSNLDAWAVENGVRTNEITLNVKQSEPAMFQRILGGIYSETSASATGTILDSLRNTEGTSVADGSTGVASIAAKSGDEGDLKAGLYILEATGTDAVNLYINTNFDFNRGTDVEVQDQSYKLLESDLTITSGGTTDVSDYGLELTGGSGTIGMTSGDMAAFTVVPEHGGIYDYSVGENGEYPEYVGLSLFSQKQADGSFSWMYFPKVKFNGMPIAFNEKGFFEGEITGVPVKAIDPYTGTYGLFRKTRVRPA